MKDLFENNLNIKPFLKWAGGKTQLLPDIDSRIKAFIAKAQGKITFVEPFVGSGAVLFFVLRKYKEHIKQAVINDANAKLINCYKIIREQPSALIKELENLQIQYFSIPDEEERRAFFLAQREKFNASSNSETEEASLMIFLNRTCFNGLYRVNAKGKFNVPFGKYSKPLICNKEVIWANHYALQQVEIMSGDFEETQKFIAKDTLFYFDPPYKPISVTSSFNAYAKDSFGDREQERLKLFCDKINRGGAGFILSNSDVKNTNSNDEYFDSLYSEYFIERVKAKRMINSDSGNRGEIFELLISNN